MPIGFETAEVQRDYCVKPVPGPIARAETLAQAAGFLEFHYPPEVESLIQAFTGFDLPVILRLQKSSFVNIVEAVKNKVLDWALQLEATGIRGEGLTFSQRDRERAQTTNVAGNVGVIGDLAAPANVVATSGPVSQLIDAAAVLRAVAAVRSHLPSMPEEKRPETEEQLSDLEVEARREEPNQSKLRSGLRKLREGAGHIGDKVIEAGVKALVDRALDGQ